MQAVRQAAGELVRLEADRRQAGGGLEAGLDLA